MTDNPTDADGLIAAPARTQAAPLALYRRYRPDTFADLIGQDHVTEPLQRALANNRVNHAYLFSGPRGCGKTTSARILARALNCEQGPTPTPCGECQSCQDLARGGPGSIDVIEIDAASHGGVDDARDLRERAFFSPVNSRYKVYIVDEAHMVTPAGFNALLKLVEEPPPHVKFIFATTEPEKVIGTIRSRTHHYPFRLVPPKTLSAYLSQLCAAEGVAVEEAVLPMVVRAGAGSVRDSLSVLDQLLGGAAEGGVSYGQAAALLGYTPDSLLDEVLDAFAAGDAGGVFAAVDKVIEVGQDPRRFAEDLLRRLRDLVIVAAVPDAVTSGLVDVSADQAERLQNQAASLGAGELTRAAEVIAGGLTEMRGTTAPRLHLELMCSRVLLPEADLDGRGLHARIDRLERRVGMNAAASVPAASVPAVSAAPAVSAVSAGLEPAATIPHVPVETQRPGPPGPAERGGAQPVADDDLSRPDTIDRAPDPGAPAPDPGSRSSDPAPRAHDPGPATDAPDMGPPSPDSTPPSPDQVAPVPVEDSGIEGPPGEMESAGLAGASSGTAGMGTADVRRLWPGVLDAVKKRRRFTWILLSQNAHVVEAIDNRLTLGLANTGARDNFLKGGSEEVLVEALVDTLGTRFSVQAIVDPGEGQGSARTGGGPPPGVGVPARSATTESAASTSAGAPAASGQAASGQASDGSAANDPWAANSATSATSVASDSGAATGIAPGSGAPGINDRAAPVAVPAADPDRSARARESIRATRHGGPAAVAGTEPVDESTQVDRDDDVLDDGFESQAELLARHLGAEVINEDEG